MQTSPSHSGSIYFSEAKTPKAFVPAARFWFSNSVHQCILCGDFQFIWSCPRDWTAEPPYQNCRLRCTTDYYGLWEQFIISPSLSVQTDNWTPNPQHLPDAQTSQRSANLWSGEGFLFLGCSNLANQKDSTISKAATLQSLKHCNSNLTWKRISTRLQKCSWVSHPPPRTAETCLCYRWVCSACQCIKKMNRRQAGEGFSLSPSFTLCLTLDFNSQKERTRNTPKQLISRLVSQ